MSDAEKCEAHALQDNHEAHVFGSGAKRHAHTDFLGPLLHGIRDEAVETDGGEEQSDHGERNEQHDVEAGPGGRCGDHFVHGANAVPGGGRR